MHICLFAISEILTSQNELKREKAISYRKMPLFSVFKALSASSASEGRVKGVLKLEFGRRERRVDWRLAFDSRDRILKSGLSSKLWTCSGV
ncbi:hypothetical protein AVEN_259300-1 [Araneus ventricosus]|uniref:Uncharacterized protein n=1 Tax=Araneus ventricosus TaxID=182803 RepID=A0A4Y2GIA8_ARAVE|nr:hypothetical protein AVEN_259300-1 [Araneus ventricosus]